MSAVIRMKRHISELPHSAFILNCKKRKTDDARQEPLTQAETSTVLKFAGTVNQGEDISEHIAKITKEDAKDIVMKKSQHPESNVKSRIDQNREKSQQNRFKIVNCTRALDETQEKPNSSMKSVTIVDVEKDRACNTALPAAGAASSSSALVSSYSDITDEPYVYDIYIAESEHSVPYPEFDMNDLSILDYNDYLYSLPRLVNSESEDEIDVDDEDSNDEDNFRNDYPDEGQISGDESTGERQMRQAMNNVEIGNDLSSEEENNEFVYSVDSQSFGFEDDLDYSDVNRYGPAYAKYKKRVLRELNESSEDEDCYDDDSFHSD